MVKDATLIADYHARVGNHELFVVPVVMFSNVIGKSFNPKLLVQNVLVSSIQSQEYPKFLCNEQANYEETEKRQNSLKTRIRRN